MYGCMNDIFVEKTSLLLEKIVNEKCQSSSKYRINTARYGMSFWLTDLLLLDWPVFIEHIMSLSTRKYKLIASM